MRITVRKSSEEIRQIWRGAFSVIITFRGPAHTSYSLKKCSNTLKRENRFVRWSFGKNTAMRRCANEPCHLFVPNVVVTHSRRKRFPLMLPFRSYCQRLLCLVSKTNGPVNVFAQEGYCSVRRRDKERAGISAPLISIIRAQMVER